MGAFSGRSHPSDPASAFGVPKYLGSNGNAVARDVVLDLATSAVLSNHLTASISIVTRGLQVKMLKYELTGSMNSLSLTSHYHTPRFLIDTNKDE